MLVLWNPAQVGVKTKAEEPGAIPEQFAIDRGSAANDPDEIEAEMKRTKADFVGAIANKEEKDFGNKTSVQVSKDIKRR